MSELQTEEAATEEVAEAATIPDGSELAPDSAAEREEIDPAKVAQDQAQKAINKQHAKYREEERKRITLEGENKQLEERLSKLEANSDVEVPPIPDSWDENFDAKMAERDKALTLQVQNQAQKTAQKTELEASEKVAEQAEHQRMTGLVDGYNKRVVTLGLDAEEITKAGDTVVSYGVSQDVAEYILTHEDGPLITKYLANNPLELDELSGMSNIQAALKINSTIKTAAATLKPQATAAPDPAETLGGRGAGEKVSSLIKGATFE